MYRLKQAAIALVIIALLCLGGPTLDAFARPLALHSPSLGVADTFAILAATGITDGNVANTTISGDVGNSGAGAQITDITCSNMAAGTIYTTDGGGPVGACVVNNSAVPGQAQAANLAAYNDLIAGDNAGCANIPNELGGNAYPAGVYCPQEGDFQITGTLTLSGTGVWIFRTVSLTVAADAQVVGSDPCNVWWQLTADGTGASIGSGADMIGNMLALDTITFGDGASLTGRALSQTGAVTLIGNTITRPVCTTTTTTENEDEGESRRNRRPTVSGLPNTGGAPIREAEFPWALVMAGGISSAAIFLGTRSYRRKDISRK